MVTQLISSKELPRVVKQTGISITPQDITVSIPPLKTKPRNTRIEEPHHLPQIQEKAEKESNGLCGPGRPPECGCQRVAFGSASRCAGRLKAPLVVLQEEEDPIQKEIEHMWHHNVPH